MSRRLAITALAALGTTAHAQAPADPAAPPDMTDQGIGVAIGLAGGGRSTSGGLRISGHYLYQLNDRDWFDGTSTFTFGSGAAACFRDRDDHFHCQHGLLDGASAEIAANVRHFLTGRGEFWPYVRGGVGVALVRFSDDSLTGFAIPLHGGAGFRVSVADGVAVIVEAGIDVGIGFFSKGLGTEPQLGGSVMGGAEFRL
jgi:hypothetical protein